MDIFSFLTLFGGLAFFLYGMNVMSSGLEKLAGGKLEVILQKITSNKWKSLLFGVGITAAVQSSSAVTVMLVGLVNSGIMQLGQTIGILMGSNIGTTLTVWLLALSGISGESVFLKLIKPESFSPVLALIGIIMIMTAKHNKTKDIGRILVGFSVLFTGMMMMGESVEPLKDSPSFSHILTAFNNPLVGVLAGAIITAVVQSSAASIGILQSLSITGHITYGMAIPIIMGQNIGTCVTALISSIGVNRSARRVAVIHIAFNCIGTIILLPILYLVNAFVDFVFMDWTISYAGIALVHTIFNVVVTFLLLPFSKLLEKLAYLVIKQLPEETQKEQLILPGEILLNTPAVAIEACRTSVNDMARLAEDTILKALSLHDNYSESVAHAVSKQEKLLDQYEDKLNAYIVRISKHSIASSDNRTVSKMLHGIGNFERIGDHALNVAQSAQEMHDKQISFSTEAKSELQTMRAALTETVHLAFDAFCKDDLNLAHQVEPMEEVIDTFNMRMKKKHIERLQKAACTVELGYIFQDLLTNFERISDHCSNIAGCLIEIEENRDMHEYLHELKKSDESFQEQYHANLERYMMQLQQFMEQNQQTAEPVKSK